MSRAQALHLIPGAALAPTRRHFLAAATTALAAAALPRAALAAEGAEARFAALCQRLWLEQLSRFPQSATAIGADTGAAAPLRARLDDWSRGGRDSWVRWAADARARLDAIDATILPTVPAADHAVLSEYFGRVATLGKRWRFGETASNDHAPVAPYALGPGAGPASAVPAILERQPVANAQDCDAWLARLAHFAGALDGATEAFRIDAGQGIVPPGFALDAAAGQLQNLAQGDALRAILARKASARGIAGDWDSRAQRIIERTVRPALERQALQIAEARGAARERAGVWQLPDGRAYYADALAFHTGSDRSADELHRRGGDELARTRSLLDAELGRFGLTGGTVAQRLSALAQSEGARLTAAQGAEEAAVEEIEATTGSSPATPSLRRYGTRYPAFGAGWALASRENAIGQTGAGKPLQRIAALALEHRRAALMVVDSGLHDRGWSREQVSAWLAEATGIAPAQATARVERCCVAPGETAAPFAGLVEWRRMAALAQRLAGDRFDRAGLAALAARGPASFPALENAVIAAFNPQRSVLAARTV